MKTKNLAWVVKLTGNGFIGVAALMFIVFQIGLLSGWSFDEALASEVVALAPVGVATSIVGRCLAGIEARLTRIEQERQGSNSPPV